MRLPGAPPPPLSELSEFDATPDERRERLLDAARKREGMKRDDIPTPDDFTTDFHGKVYPPAVIGNVASLVGEGLTFGETGKRVGLSEDQVRNLVYRIRKWVAKKSMSERGRRGAAATHARHREKT